MNTVDFKCFVHETKRDSIAQDERQCYVVRPLAPSSVLTISSYVKFCLGLVTVCRSRGKIVKEIEHCQDVSLVLTHNHGAACRYSNHH